jgi:hypothetical protein
MLPVRVNHGVQSSLRDQRHIPAQDENVAVKVAEAIFRAENRVRRAKLLFLNYPDHVIAGIGPLYVLGAVPDNDDDAPRLDPVCCGKNMKE